MALKQATVSNISQAAQPHAKLADRLRSYLSTTPGQLTGALVTCVFATLIAAFCAYYAYSDVRHAVQTVGRDTVPSIVAAEHINATLADANANVANALLTKEPETGPSWKAYRDDMKKVQDQLITATQNITYGDEERKPIFTMMAKIGEYEYAVGKARAKLSGDFTNDFLIANRSMRESILPAGAALDQANFSHLDETYKVHRAYAWLHKSLLFIFLATMAVVLVAAQLFLFRKTHRLVNPGIAIATVMLLAFALYAVTTLDTVENTLISAKQDAFDSIHALWKARAVAYDANADESLYLLYHGDKDNQAKATSDFKGKAALLSDIAPQDALVLDSRGEKFGGFLGAELANITFAGEKEAATQTLKEWAAYIRIDGDIRRLEQQGGHNEAIALNIGTKPGQSNWQFDKFDKALGATLDINQKEFDQKISSAFLRLSVFPYVLAAWIVVVIAASIVGMKPRLDEYRF